ncbi:Lactose phosphotransferase system repressor [compost metagenome]
MKIVRLKQIEDYVNAKQSATLEELSDAFNVSLMTIRRDIESLSREGAIKKVYGGVTATNSRDLLTFEERDIVEMDEKKKIAKAAAQFIQKNDVVFIDSGTTTRYIVDYLDKDLTATIISNSLDIFNTVSNYPNINLITVGTHFNKRTRSFVGKENWPIIEKYNISKGMFSCTSLSLEKGASITDISEYEMKKRAFAKVSQSFLLVDKSKMNTESALTFAHIQDFDMIITDSEVPDFAQYCSENNVHYLVAED